MLILPAREFPPLQRGLAKSVIALAIRCLPFVRIGVREKLRALAGGQHLEIDLQRHVAADLHLLFARSGAASGVIIEQRRRLGHGGVFEKAIVTNRRLKIPVRRLVLGHQQERFRFVALLQPVERHLRDHVGRVTLHFFLLTVGLDELRMPVRALSLEDAIIIKPLRCMSHVPFADQCRLVPRSLQGRGKRPHALADTAAQVRDAVDVGVNSA